MDEEVVQLRNDGGRDVGRALAGDGHEHAELSALLDDFFQQLETVVFPAFALPRRLLGQDVVGLVDDEVNRTVRRRDDSRLVGVVEVLVDSFPKLGHSRTRSR